MNKVLNRTTHGKVYVCSKCDKLHIEFNNFAFSFKEKEYEYFSECLNRVDGEYYESLNYNSPYSRKIIIPIGHKNVSMLLSKVELREFVQLLNFDKKVTVGEFLSFKEINIAGSEHLN